MKRLILIIVALLVAGGAWAQNRMDLTKQQDGLGDADHLKIGERRQEAEINLQEPYGG
jgi:hypothetical protein